MIELRGEEPQMKANWAGQARPSLHFQRHFQRRGSVAKSWQATRTAFKHKDLKQLKTLPTTKKLAKSEHRPGSGCKLCPASPACL